MINASRRERWKQDLTAAATNYNQWYLEAGSRAYRDARARFVSDAEQLLDRTEQLSRITAKSLRAAPASLTSLRMATSPPLARDRLVTLANTVKPLVTSLEQGRLPVRMSPSDLDAHLTRICAVVTGLLDLDVFDWVTSGIKPTAVQRQQATFVVADRRCDTVSDVVLRQAQRSRQRDLLEDWLLSRGYRNEPHPHTQVLDSMAAGTFSLDQPVVVGGHTPVDIAVDAVVQPRRPASHRMPVVIDAVSTVDLGRPDRSKKDAARVKLLHRSYGRELNMLLLLGGVVDAGYLKSQAAEGLDWVWEHRIDDLTQAGL